MLLRLDYKYKRMQIPYNKYPDRIDKVKVFKIVLKQVSKGCDNYKYIVRMFGGKHQ